MEVAGTQVVESSLPPARVHISRKPGSEADPGQDPGTSIWYAGCLSENLKAIYSLNLGLHAE